MNSTLSANKRILIVWTGNWPWDIRIEKEAKTLQKAGLEVCICSRNTKNLPTFEVLDNISVYRFFNFFKGSSLISDILSTPFYINPLWILHILKTILKTKPKIIIVRDIPLFLTCAFWAKIFKIKIILDVAEHWPAQIKVNKKYVNNWFTELLFCKLDWYKHIEKFSVKKADKIWVVVEEQKQRLMDDYGVEENKINVVSNTPCKNILSKHNTSTENNSLKIVYTGGVDGIFRGIQTIINTAKILKNLNKNDIIISIIGDGSYLEYYRKISEENNLINIKFLGRKPHTELLDYLNTQDIGIVPHIKCDIIDYTIPNKLFDYMAHSLPVIVSSAKPIKRIVEETDCGYVFESDNPQSLADLLIYISNNKQELEMKAKNGYKAVEEKYNWENDENNILMTLEEL